MSLKVFLELKTPWHFRQITVSSLFNSWWAQGAGIGVGTGIVTLCYAHSCAWQAVAHVWGVHPGEQRSAEQVPGPSRREGQRRTHLQHHSGRDRRPQAEQRHHITWDLGRRWWGCLSRGRQPSPAIEAHEHTQDPGRSRPALLMTSPLDIFWLTKTLV